MVNEVDNSIKVILWKKGQIFGLSMDCESRYTHNCLQACKKNDEDECLAPVGKFIMFKKEKDNKIFILC